MVGSIREARGFKKRGDNPLPIRITSKRWYAGDYQYRYYYINHDRRRVCESSHDSLVGATMWVATNLEEYRAFERGEIE